MVRSELLRAKSLHAEVAYLRDLQVVGDAKRREQQEKSVLREKERRFWAEAIKGRPANAAQQVALPPQMQTTAQLERMRQAHSQLSHAHRTHEQATHKLNEGLATLSTSQKRIEILEKLLAKAQRIRANQVESRLSEEVADLVTTSRTVLNLRAMLGAEGDPRNIASLRDTVSESGSPGERFSTTSQPPIQNPPLLGITGQVVPPLVVPVVSPQLQISPPSPVSTGHMGISHISFSPANKEPTLSLSCALGAQGTVGLRVTKAESGGGLKVVIDPSAGGVASGVMREKGAIQARLQALGIKVSAIEIGVVGDDAPVSSGAKRSRLYEEEDESDIS